MLVRKFYADTSREALRLVRAALGPDAMILSNRRAGSGIEIMAVAPDEIQVVTEAASLPQDSTPLAGMASRQDDPRADNPRRVLSEDAASRHTGAQYSGAQYSDAQNSDAQNSDAQYGGAQYSDAQQVEVQQADAQQTGLPALPMPAATAVDTATRAALAAYGEHAPPEPGGYELVHEVRLLRSMLEGQLAAFAWTDLKRRDPARGDVMRRLLVAGFSTQLARETVEELPEGLAIAGALRLTKTRLQQRLRTVSPGAGLVDGGGILALVGPTGVGKTTTVAKLAAECAIKHGAAQLALVTTDTYRIGAVDQLRIYGRLLGVPVFAIRSESDLRATLDDLRTRHLVLIDTVGMSQRDRRLADQVALLSGTTRRVQRVLLLSAVAQASVLDDVVRAYRGEDLAGCILTKLDEALTPGAALDVLIRHQLTLHYVATGQRVPEDLHKPNPLYLVERAFRDGAQGAVLDDGDVPATLAAGQN